MRELSSGLVAKCCANTWQRVTWPQGDEPALSMRAALQRVRIFASRFEITEDGAGVYDQLLELLQQVRIAGKQVRDANLVATMRGQGILRLLTFNTAAFNRFDSVIELSVP
ncbi:MAG TPA: PIN domain-containing protein [Acetobacteraceae bacterium]|nr:PIN domain-containing protein [Acetobacteraceae bacterium]